MIGLCDAKYIEYKDSISDYYRVNSFILDNLFKIETVDSNETIPIAIECTTVENDRICN